MKNTNLLGRVVAVAAMLLAGAGLAYFLVQQIQTSKGTVEVVSENPKEVQVFIEQNGQPVKILYQRDQKQQVDIDVGNYRVRLGEGGQGWLPEPSDFTLTHEVKTLLTIKRDTGQRAGKAKHLVNRADIARHAPGSVLTLADFTGAQIDKNVATRLKEVLVLDRPYVKRSAWVGTESLPHVFVEHFKNFSFMIILRFERDLQYHADRLPYNTKS